MPASSPAVCRKSPESLAVTAPAPLSPTHAIEVLLDLLKTQGEPVPENVDEALILTEYAVQTRYPGEWEPVTKKEAQKVLEQAVLVLSWVESRIGR